MTMKVSALKPLTTFSLEIIDYLDTLSKEINKDSHIQEYPDVRTFHFFAEKPIYCY